MLTIEHAHQSDLAEVKRLIGAAGLPLAGLGDVPTDVFVARDSDVVVGTASLERHGGHGLLRSVAVGPDHRGQGIGSALATAAEARSDSLGLDGVYLLTDTAGEFFAHRGYVTVKRDAGPAPIMASVEWAEACGETATPMLLRRS